MLADEGYQASCKRKRDEYSPLGPFEPPRTTLGRALLAEAAQEGLVPRRSPTSNTGYLGVYFNGKAFQVHAPLTSAHGASYLTADHAAVARERAIAFKPGPSVDDGRVSRTTRPPPPPPPVPSTAAGAEAVRQAGREGLTLATSSNNSRYKGVYYQPVSKNYKLQVRVGGKTVTLGCFATAEQAALFYARREAGRDTSDTTAPPVR